MKKQLTVALGLAVLATPAFATKARLQSLGEDSYGSFYINDNRNIWLNAAQINNHRDLVTFEFGASDAKLDSAGSPRAEGGYYGQAGNLVYGVHFGGASTTSNLLRTAANVDKNEENNLDFFVGGDTGLKWGANLGYSKSNKDEADADSRQDALRTRLGVIAGDTQGYANINLANKAESAAGQEFKGKIGYQIGAIQAWNGNSLFVEYRDFKGTNETTDNEISHKRIQLGWGRVTRLNDRANLFTRANLDWFKTENDNSTNDLGEGGATECQASTAGAFCEEFKTTRLPVVVGLEAEATSWLTLRASVSQTVWGKEQGADDERGIDASTVVNAGATLKFGELAVDGVIGNGDGSGATPAAANATGTQSATLRTDSLMTRVAMTYRF